MDLVHSPSQDGGGGPRLRPLPRRGGAAAQRSRPGCGLWSGAGSAPDSPGRRGRHGSGKVAEVTPGAGPRRGAARFMPGNGVGLVSPRHGDHGSSRLPGDDGGGGIRRHLPTRPPRGRRRRAGAPADAGGPAGGAHRLPVRHAARRPPRARGGSTPRAEAVRPDPTGSPSARPVRDGAASRVHGGRRRTRAGAAARAGAPRRARRLPGRVRPGPPDPGAPSPVTGQRARAPRAPRGAGRTPRTAPLQHQRLRKPLHRGGFISFRHETSSRCRLDAAGSSMTPHCFRQRAATGCGPDGCRGRGRGGRERPERPAAKGVEGGLVLRRRNGASCPGGGPA